MLHIGIDIAKRSHEVAILDEQGVLCGKPFSIKNKREGVDYLMKRLRQVNPQGQSLRFGLEATGHYWLALYCALEDLGHHVTVLNPMQSAAYRKLQIRPVKTDRVDARCIAEVIRIRPAQPSPYTNEKLYSLRQLTRLRNELIQQNSLNKRRALAVVDRVFPEFETLFSHVFGKTARAILVHYGTPQRISALDVETLTTFIRHHSGGKLGGAKAELVLQTAQNSFSARLGQDVAHLQLRLLIEQIEFVEQQIETLETEIETYMTEIPQTLTTIPGIAKGLAATLIAEIGDIGDDLLQAEKGA
jgi:transposase